MSRSYYYSITVDSFVLGDAKEIENVFTAYGLTPETSEIEVESFGVIDLPNEMSARAFNEEFADAIWHALGRYARIRMGSTCISDPSVYVDFCKTAYKTWAAERKPK